MYHPQHHEPQPSQQHQQSRQPPQQQQPQQQPGHGYESSHSSTDAQPSASNLDHALLESLFYNEMVMLEPSDPSPPVLLPTTEHDTPHTIVEKEILRDFGVGGGTTLFAPPPETPGYNKGHDANNAPQNGHSADAASGYPTTSVLPQPGASLPQQQQQQPIHHAPQPSSTIPQYTTNVSNSYNISTDGTSNASPAATPSGTMLSHPPQQQQQHPPPSQVPLGGMVYMDPQATATAAAAAAAMNGALQVQSTASIPCVPTSSSLKTPPPMGQQPQHPSPTAVAAPAVSATTPTPVAAAPPSGNGAAFAPPPAPGSTRVPEDRARQLVDQFATLASRLGIDLPDSVLQSLTSAAAKNDPTLLMNQKQKSTAPPKGAATITTAVAASKAPASASTAPATQDDGLSSSTTELSAMAPTVMELRKTAEEAIAAVTQSNTNHRTAEKPSGPSANQSHPSTDNKPTYSKRRKKPRLSDCEAKLAQLKAENEQLKRHLQNVSNKAHKFDKEKEEAGKQIARLVHDPNAGPREMELSVQKFSDMYSDYGINRQQELSFHLEQLQRLVNPTNFTKMGLWTLGQSSQGTKKNPIAGILVKELDITPQQGRKILDQSEKIRKLCDNLKEAHALLVKLKHLCEKKTQCFQDRMNKCNEILTSKQVVKLIIWINENTELLEKVCPGWGTEHIHPKK